MLSRRHTDREYEQELETLRERVLLMGARVEQMIDHAMRAFTERNPGLGRSTIQQDSQIDGLELEIDELCLQLLARRQPMASDLRFITTSLKLVTDLERIG
ncbi:MAG TPA: PhoU domain-containing protein, partial [Polyangiaceae bacterium]|nr:PhoU domain-containing protein [Polyangiaceae bacterium]